MSTKQVPGGIMTLIAVVALLLGVGNELMSLKLLPRISAAC